MPNPRTSIESPCWSASIKEEIGVSTTMPHSSLVILGPIAWDTSVKRSDLVILKSFTALHFFPRERMPRAYDY